MRKTNHLYKNRSKIRLSNKICRYTYCVFNVSVKKEKFCGSSTILFTSLYKFVIIIISARYMRAQM